MFERMDCNLVNRPQRARQCDSLSSEYDASWICKKQIEVNRSVFRNRKIVFSVLFNEAVKRQDYKTVQRYCSFVGEDVVDLGSQSKLKWLGRMNPSVCAFVAPVIAFA